LLCLKRAVTNQGPARTISAEEAKTTLAYPCFYILMGLAEPVFPGASRAKPSVFVRIIQTHGGRPYDLLSGLPVDVQWKQWQEEVLPVLEDDRWKVNTPMMRDAFKRGAEREWVENIGKALYDSFEDAGYALNS